MKQNWSKIIITRSISFNVFELNANTIIVETLSERSK